MSSAVRRQRLLAGVAGAAIVVSLGLNAPARAQGVPMWTGLYVGGNLGVAWGRAKTTTTVDCNVPAFPFPYICNNAGVGAADAAAIDAAGTSTDNDTAFTGGIQAGYNY